jgi:hypothetical protein
MKIFVLGIMLSFPLLSGSGISLKTLKNPINQYLWAYNSKIVEFSKLVDKKEHEYAGEIVTYAYNHVKNIQAFIQQHATKINGLDTQQADLEHSEWALTPLLCAALCRLQEHKTSFRRWSGCKHRMSL